MFLFEVLARQHMFVGPEGFTPEGLHGVASGGTQPHRGHGPNRFLSLLVCVCVSLLSLILSSLSLCLLYIYIYIERERDRYTHTHIAKA